MKKAKRNQLSFKVLNLLIDTAPVTNTCTRSSGWWGEPEYPNEKDYM